MPLVLSSFIQTDISEIKRQKVLIIGEEIYRCNEKNLRFGAHKCMERDIYKAIHFPKWLL